MVEQCSMSTWCVAIQTACNQFHFFCLNKKSRPSSARAWGVRYTWCNKSICHRNTIYRNRMKSCFLQHSTVNVLRDRAALVSISFSSHCVSHINGLSILISSWVIRAVAKWHLMYHIFDTKCTAFSMLPSHGAALLGRAINKVHSKWPICFIRLTFYRRFRFTIRCKYICRLGRNRFTRSISLSRLQCKRS